MTYTKLSDRSVETCEAYRRGRACGSNVIKLRCYNRNRYIRNDMGFLFCTFLQKMLDTDSKMCGRFRY